MPTSRHSVLPDPISATTSAEHMSEIRMAVIESNVLAGMGLQTLLNKIIPQAVVCYCASYEALMANDPECFAHYFVAARIYFEHTFFFRQRPFCTIVLTNGENLPPTPGLLTLNVCQTEEALITDLLHFHSIGHGTGPHRPRLKSISQKESTRKGGKGDDRQPLTLREIEVATLLARGYTNKEVADRLNISLTTVITHRKNLMVKLEAHSLSDIIIYAVMNGHLDLGE